jgi:hypothetical protein
MIHVSEVFGINRRSLRAAFDTFSDACAYVNALNPICFEVDEDNENCADAYMAGGMIYVIEPAN